MITISISHRTIRIGAIFIAVLLLAAMAVPARSLETVKGGIIIELPNANQQIHESPFKESVSDESIWMYTADIRVMGLQEIGETKHAWAVVHLTNHNQQTLGFSSKVQLLYLPSPRLQSLFEMAKMTDAYMAIEVHPIEKPDGWNLFGSWTVYKVTSVSVY